MTPKPVQKFTLKFQLVVEPGVFEDGDISPAQGDNITFGKCDALVMIGISEEDNRGWEEVWVRCCDGRNVSNKMRLEPAELFRAFLALAAEIKMGDCQDWQKDIAALTIECFLGKSNANPPPENTDGAA